jgi:hypothetical protein
MENRNSKLWNKAMNTVLPAVRLSSRGGNQAVLDNFAPNPIPPPDDSNANSNQPYDYQPLQPQYQTPPSNYLGYNGQQTQQYGPYPNQQQGQSSSYFSSHPQGQPVLPTTDNEYSEPLHHQHQPMSPSSSGQGSPHNAQSWISQPMSPSTSTQGSPPQPSNAQLPHSNNTMTPPAGVPYQSPQPSWYGQPGQTIQPPTYPPTPSYGSASLPAPASGQQQGYQPPQNHGPSVPWPLCNRCGRQAYWLDQ